MAADDRDEQGVLGNLPRSRPGRRSAKRTSATGDGGGSPPRAKAKAAKTTSRPASRSSSAKPTASRPGTGGSRPSARSTPKARTESGGRPERQEPGDPLSQAVRLAGKVAETGMKTGVGILKRLSGR
jgi:hypothetical protein